jgi:ATP-binding cassette subfamily B protein
MADDLTPLFWPFQRLRQAMEALIVRSGMPASASAIGDLPGDPATCTVPLGSLQWIHAAARRMGCEARVEALLRMDTMDRLAGLRGSCLFLFTDGQPRALAVVFDPTGDARFLLEDGSERRVKRWRALAMMASLMPTHGLESLFEGLPGGDHASRALFDAELAKRTFAYLVEVGPDAANSIVAQLAHARHWRWLAAYLLVSALQVALVLGAFATLGAAAFDGRVDVGRIVGWGMLALTDVPLQYAASRCLGRFSVSLSSILQRRVLEGTFRVEERSVRAQGHGALIARAGEAVSIQPMTLADTVGVITAVGQVVIAGLLFARATRPLPLLLCLLVFTASAVGLAVSMWQRFSRAYARRVGLADDLVDKIIGHRTRVLQEMEGEHHTDEDLAMAEYGRLIRGVGSVRALLGLLSRSWLVCSGGLLVMGFLLHDATSSLVWTALGIAFAARALTQVPTFAQRGAEAATAYRGIAPLLEAGAVRDRPHASSSPVVGKEDLPNVLAVSSVSFAYRSAGRRILSDVTFRVRAGERILLRGPSGGGKSTLFKLIGGELQPSGGVILVAGSDYHSVSESEWRRRVASAPQFHENYVFSQSFRFNLGARGDAMADQDGVCEELGLGPLLARMPQGYQQLLGETGWQLSHGEKSRLYIARALLQGSELMLFDESFGALDPLTQLKTLECLRRRCKTLLIISHA